MKVKMHECQDCGLLKPITDFAKYERRDSSTYSRKSCYKCAELKRRERISASYESFLHNLWVRTKNRVGREKATAKEFSIPEDYLKNLWTDTNGRCSLSGVHMTHHSDGSGRKDLNASVDRIDVDRGYVPGNVQLVCHRVNIMRNNLSVSEFYWWIKTLHDHSCD
jgi:hypothetical protein